jgi:hypothetical protein
MKGIHVNVSGTDLDRSIDIHTTFAKAPGARCCG